MFSRDDDETEDTRKFRRSLEPLDIEDAEKPPSLVRRMAGLFRRKKEIAAPEPEPAISTAAGDEAPPEDFLPESLDPEDENPGQG